jgi:uncharacterized protein (TIGR03437 family)
MTASGQTIAYGTAANLVAGAGTITVTGLVNGDSGTPGLSTNAVVSFTFPNAGTWNIIPAVGTIAPGNYNITVNNGTLTVNKLAISVTAKPQTITYGNTANLAAGSGTVAVATLVTGDTGAPSLSTNAALTNGNPNATNGTPWTVTPSAGTISTSNYIITFNNGSLTVNRSPLTVTATNASKAYGTTFAATVFTTSGLLSGDSVSSVTLSNSGAAGAATVAGSPYSIVSGAAVGTGLSNYAISYVNGTLTVNRAALTVTANNASRVYGAVNPTFSAAIAGFVNGENSSALAGVPGMTTTATAASPAGVYPIAATFGTLSAANYTFTFANGTLTVLVAPLAIITTNLPAGVFGQAYGSFQAVATGGSGRYTFLASGLPPGMSISPGGQAVGTPTLGGTFGVTIWVSDGSVTVSTTLSLTVGYGPLQITGSGTLGGFAPGASISGALTATGGQTPYIWSATGLPAGFNLNAASGTFSGVAAPGSYSVTVKVTDSRPTPSSSTGTVTFNVLGITTLSLPVAPTTGTYAQTITAIGGAPPYTFSASGLPSGLSLAGSGLLSGTPTSVGSFSVSIQVKDSGGLTTSAGLSLVVSGPASALNAAGGALPGGNISVAYSTSLQATGGTPPYTWSQTGGNLPDGLTLSGSGAVQGTPKTAGTYTFTTKVIDTTPSSSSGAFTITIASPTLKLSLPSFPNGIVGIDYPQQILTSSGGIAPYAFAVTSGNLPNGLTLSSPQFSGTPTASGAFTFVVTATDSSGATASGSGSIAISPPHPDLVISQSSLPFSLTVGSNGLPTPANVTVRSSDITQLLNYSLTVAPAASWLIVTGGGNTPGSVGIALDPSALSLGAALYQTTINIACVAPSPCAGNIQPVAVSLTVTSPSPELSTTSTLLSFQAVSSNPRPASQPLGIQNTGGGTLTIRGVTPADSWLSVSGAPSTLQAGPAASFTVTANSAGLSPKYYTSSILVDSSAGSATVPVSLLVASNLVMSLAPAGTQFATLAGSAPGSTSGSFLVSVSGGTAANWNASVLPGSDWLKITTGGGKATSSSPGTVGFTIDATLSAALAPQTYYGTIRVTSGDVLDSPLDFGVVLNVTAAATPVKPDLSPAGLVFSTSGVGGFSVPQNVRVGVSSGLAVPYQASARTGDGGAWLIVSPARGSASSSSPGQSSVSINTTGLARGIYRGGVSYAFSSASVRTVNVTLIVGLAPGGTISAAGATINAVDLKVDEPQAADSTCVTTQLFPTQTGLVSNFQQPAGWPTALTVEVFGDCGPLAGGQAIASFSNGDPPLALEAVDTSSGIYTGTWTPRAVSSQVTITSTVTASSLAASTQITGAVTPNGSPILTLNGALHAFAPQAGGAVAPGTILQIYGLNLATQPAAATTVPLANTLGGTSVLIGGLSAPLYYVSPGQINAQAPFELISGNQYQIQVNANGALSTPGTIQVGAATPGVATLPTGQAVAQHADYSLVTSAAPAKPGEYITLYLAGLGATDYPVATGAGSPSSPLARPLTAPILTLNGAQVPIAFAGLTPMAVGLYQINIQIPASIAEGDLNLVVSQAGSASNTSILPVRH